MTRELLRLRAALAGRRFDLLLDLQFAIRASLDRRAWCGRRSSWASTARARANCSGFSPMRRLRRPSANTCWTPSSASCGPAESRPARPSGILNAAGGCRCLRRTRSSTRRGRRSSSVRVPATRDAIGPPERYAAVAAHAGRVHGMRVILVGGAVAPSARIGTAIEAASARRSSIKSARTRCRSCSPCSPAARCWYRPIPAGTHGEHGRIAGDRFIRRHQPGAPGPYLSRQWCVDKYDEAARTFLGKPAAAIPWTRKIEVRGVMDLIGVGDVTAKLDALMQQSDTVR